MKLRLNRAAGVAGAAMVATAVLVAVPQPAATAAPANWSFSVSSTPANVGSGSELALDANRRELFIADNDSYISTRGETDFSVNPRPIDPKVSVFNIDTRKTVRSISFAGQPIGIMEVAGIPAAPMPQIPDGIGIDTKRARVVTSNSHGNGITVAGMRDRTTSARNLISVPGGHPMGVAINPANGIAYVALNYINQLAIIDTNTRREIRRIPTFAPSLLDVDPARQRLYIGNADFNAKKTHHVTVLDMRTNRVIKKITTPANSRPKVDPSTGLVYAASFVTGKVSVIDPDSLSIVRTIETHSTPNKLAIDSQRRLLYLSNLQKRSLTVIDLDGNKVIRTVPVNAPIHTIAVDPRTGTVFGTQHQGRRLTIVTVTQR